MAKTIKIKIPIMEISNEGSYAIGVDSKVGKLYIISDQFILAFFFDHLTSDSLISFLEN
jgi:hypothetical protein